nr:E3 SUMO-protein ligase NSE2-like [Nerophis lumbriciformis]
MWQNWSGVRSGLSSLRSCQAGLVTAMDLVTTVATDLVEEEGDPGTSEMEALMLECVKLDREIDCFVDTVQQVTSEFTEQQQEDLFAISSIVKERFTESISQLSDINLQTHQNLVSFKQSIRRSRNQDSQELENMEELDVDVAVTQTQVIFTCPLTQAEMVNPVKNKKCNHHYDEEPIRLLIEKRRQLNKKCRCPVVGCENLDLRDSDLIPDHSLKTQIMNKPMQSNETFEAIHLSESFVT